jgi:hypothetical protein
VSCLPDGSGRLALRTSGGLAIDLVAGNDFFCPGAAGEMGNAYLNWVVPVPGNELRAAFNITIDKLARGETGTGKSMEVAVLIAGEMGNIWNTRDLCKVDVTANTQAASSPMTIYKVSGVIRCSAPIVGIRQPSQPLTIQRFEFTSAVVFE